MKRMVARIGPVVPAFATVAASVCASSLLFATGPRALEPPPVVPPLTREVGRVVASLSPPSQTFTRGRGPAARPVKRRSVSAPLRRLATATPTPHRSSRQVSPVGASAAPLPSPPTPPPSPPSPPPAPAVAPAPAPVTVAQATTDKGKPPKDGSKPGWGNGDPNHDHTGPPGKESKNQATSPGPPEPAAAASDQHGSDQNGEKKSTVR
jgi:hypothetical protein